MKTQISKIESIIKYTFKDKSLLETALCHSSYANEHKVLSNERFEFLGDTVLNFIISEKLFFEVDKTEGSLSKMRARLVSEDPLFELGKKLTLDIFLKRGVGELKNPIAKSMVADSVEAVIGAIYLDGGMDEAKRFVQRNFSESVNVIETADIIDDAKSYLQINYTKEAIKYKTNKKGEEHQPEFTTKVYVNGTMCGIGVAQNKRTAEQLAAKQAIEKLNKNKQGVKN